MENNSQISPLLAMEQVLADLDALCGTAEVSVAALPDAWPLMDSISKAEYEHFSALIADFCDTDDQYDQQKILKRLEADSGPVADAMKAMMYWSLSASDSWHYMALAAKEGHPGAIYSQFKNQGFGWHQSDFDLDTLGYQVYRIARRENLIGRSSRRLLLGRGPEKWVPAFPIDSTWLEHTVSAYSKLVSLNMGGAEFDRMQMGERAYQRLLSMARTVLSMPYELSRSMILPDGFKVMFTNTQKVHILDVRSGVSSVSRLSSLRAEIDEQVSPETFLRDWLFFGLTVKVEV